MKKSIVLLFFVFVVLISCKSKVIDKTNTFIETKDVNYIPYYLKVYEADSLYVIKKYEESFNVLDSLFNIFQPRNTFRINEFETYCKTKIILKKKTAKNDFVKLISKYGYSKVWIESDSIMNFFFDSNKDLQKKYYLNRELYIQKINLDLRKKIIKLVEEDQKYRVGKKNSNTLFMRRIADSLNEIEIIKIFQTYGYPNRDLIGNYTIDDKEVMVDPILYHTSTSKNNMYFLNKVFEYVTKGMADPTTYAFMVDRLKLSREENQNYGTFENETNLSLKVINRNRKNIGLPSINYERWKINKIYPELN
jgi:hypothetical protein